LVPPGRPTPAGFAPYMYT